MEIKLITNMLQIVTFAIVALLLRIIKFEIIVMLQGTIVVPLAIGAT